jgi:selenocysteine lyase/cysteine desulfurase
VSAEQATYFADTRYVPDAQRFDMGERDYFITLEMASIGMEMMAAWGSEAVVARLAALTQRLAAGLDRLDVVIPNRRVRAPHLLCLAFPGGMSERLIDRLAAHKVFVAPRLGRMRISPHVYNDEADVDRFVAVMRSML